MVHNSHRDGHRRANMWLLLQSFAVLSGDLAIPKFDLATSTIHTPLRTEMTKAWRTGVHSRLFLVLILLTAVDSEGAAKAAPGRRRLPAGRLRRPRGLSISNARRRVGADSWLHIELAACRHRDEAEHAALLRWNTENDARQCKNSEIGRCNCHLC